MLSIPEQVLSKAKAIPTDVYRYAIASTFVLVVFYLVGMDSRLSVHNLMELSGIVLAVLVFAITLNAQDYLNNEYVLFLGISVISVAFVNLLHLLSSGGMNLSFEITETNVTAQLWIAAQYLQASALLAAPFYIGKKMKVDAILLGYALAAFLVSFSIFYWNIFPTSYIRDVGQTSFARVNEWIISAAFLLSLALLVWKRSTFEKKIFQLLCAYIVAALISKIFFVLPATDGPFSLMGNFLEIVSFFFLYQVVAFISFKDPYKQLLQSVKNKMDALQASEQKFRSVADSMRNALITFDGEGSVIYWNKGAKQMFGYDEKEVLGKPFILGIENMATRECLVPAIENNPIEVRGLRKNGEAFPMEVSSSSWKIGRERFYTSIVRDISRQKESERRVQEYAEHIAEEKARDDALLLSIADGILVTDMSGKITYVNRALERLCGKDAKELLQHDLDAAIPFFDDREMRVPKEKRPVYIALGSDAPDTLPISTSITFHLVNKKDKRKIPLSISAAPFVIDGEVMGAVVVWRDITHEKEVDKAKNEFISFASHQLRTPLTSISLAIDMMLHHVRDALTKEQKKYLKIAFGGVKEMTDLIETLLNISRIQMGTLVVSLEPVSLAKFSDKLLQDLSIPLQEREIRVKKSYENLPVITVDQRLLRIVFENLLGNAIKYSPVRGTVLVEIKKKGRDALIAVSDTGGGIPKDQQKKIFEKLFRVEIDDQVKGSGLGLYIAKASVDQYGGKIWCESPSPRAFANPKEVPGQKGTTFYVTIPLAGMDTQKKVGE